MMIPFDPKDISGPLLAINGFHPGCLKWCVMHTLNLGLVFVCNGGALRPTLIQLTFFFSATSRAPHCTISKSKWFANIVLQFGWV